MRLRLHKISPSRHILETLRDDGSCDRQELDSRSFVRHDLMHFCVEQRAAIRNALLGALARGELLAGMTDTATATPPAAEFLGIEILVGLMQGAVARGAEPEAFVGTARDYLATQGQPTPPFFDAAFVRAVLADWHRLHEQWLSLRIGGILELRASAP